jgi:hypothetical protein
MHGTETFSNQTVRNIIYTSVGGSQVRIQLSNTFGSSPLTVGAVSVGEVLAGARLVPGTSQPLTFGGSATVTIPAGSEVLSDPLPMHVLPLEELAVSIYLPNPTGPATSHAEAQQTAYIATGNQTAATAAYTPAETDWYFLDRLDVIDPSAPGTVVAFGDSITDGAGSQAGANDRWPNYLARRASPPRSETRRQA